MTTTYRDNVFNQGADNNYLIGGNLFNAFVLGELGSNDDFFLIGAEPEMESNYPLLTGNILDSEGNVLFRLIKNTLAFNPGHCSKVLGNHIGYEIHDGTGKMIFKVETKLRQLPTATTPCWVTEISANFYNKDAQLVFVAGSGGAGQQITTQTKCAFGFAGNFSNTLGMSNDELDLAKIMLTSRGSINKVISGRHTKEHISFDGVALVNAQIIDCDIALSTGDFEIYGKSIEIGDCRFHFSGAAEKILSLVPSFVNLKPPGRTPDFRQRR